MTPDAEQLLDAAVARGIITPAQRDAMVELGRDAPPSAVPVSGPRSPFPTEAARGFNAITVAYIVGAMLVLFAFGWFLVDRWEALGAGGVLAVSLTYTALFIVVARTLRGMGFVTASGFATLLAVAMTPVTAWALQSLTGLWPDASSRDPLRLYPPWMAWRWIIVELATIGAALVALRRVRFAPLALGIAVPLAFLIPRLATAIAPEIARYRLEERATLVAGTGLLLIAYALDRARGEEDYAAWFYATALAACALGYVWLWGDASPARHALAPIALLLIVASLYLRRRLVLVAGLLAAFWYLGWLAFDVFRKVLDFPVVLATFGLIVILATVWAQRRYPMLVSRVSGSGERRRDLIPGGWYAASGPFIIALALLVAEVPEARERAKDAEWREAIMLRRNARMEAAARRENGERRAPPRR
jgi:MFS family permease